MATLIKNRICYLLLTLAVLLFSIYYRQSFFLVLLLLLVFLPAVSYVLSRYAFGRTAVSLSSKAHAADKPATLPLFITLGNESVIPLAHVELTLLISSCFYKNEQKERLVLPAYAKRQAMHTFPVSYTKSGCYRAQLLRVLTYDFLHLFRFSREGSAQAEVLIMPCATGAIGRHNALYGEGFDEFEETSAKGNVSSNVTDVREYRPGDRLQKIHWKLTARTDELMVKENEATASNRFVVLAELYQPLISSADDAALSNILDQTLDHTFRIGRELLLSGECFFLYCYSVRQKDFLSFYIRDIDAFYQALSQIFYESPYEEDGLAAAIYDKAHPAHGTLLHVTHRGVRDVVY